MNYKEKALRTAAAIVTLSLPLVSVGYAASPLTSDEAESARGGCWRGAYCVDSLCGDTSTCKTKCTAAGVGWNCNETFYSKEQVRTEGTGTPANGYVDFGEGGRQCGFMQHCLCKDDGFWADGPGPDGLDVRYWLPDYRCMSQDGFFSYQLKWVRWCHDNPEF